MLKLILKLGVTVGLVLLTVIQLNAQNGCKVLKKEISSEYHGKCKKGLAHGKGKADGIDSYTGHFSKGYPSGKGTYTWANGDKYKGQFIDGLRSGEGTLTIHLKDHDSIVKGLWKEDIYLGPVPPKPKVFSMNGVDRYTFKKTGDIRQRVLIDIYQNGMRNTELYNFIENSSSGFQTSLGNSFGYDCVEFPVTIKVLYYTWNKLHTAKVYVKFQFEISEPGDWRVRIFN